MALTYTLENVIQNENKTATFLILNLSSGEKAKIILLPEDFKTVTTALEAKNVIKAKITETLQYTDTYQQVTDALKGFIGKEIV